MTYVIEAKKLGKWLAERGFTVPEAKTVSPSMALNHMRPYQTVLDRQVLADLRTLHGCTVRSDGHQYLLLSPELGQGSGSGYSLSIHGENGSDQGDSAFGYQWIITYGGNICRLRLFAIADRGSRLGGVEIQLREGDGKGRKDIIVHMRTIAETNAAMVEIRFALASWVDSIQQEVPTDIEPTDASFA